MTIRRSKPFCMSTAIIRPCQPRPPMTELHHQTTDLLFSGALLRILKLKITNCNTWRQTLAAIT